MKKDTSLGRAGYLLWASCLLSGCLSADALPIREPDDGAEDAGDDGEDGDDDNDGFDDDDGVEGCTDRGSYKLDDLQVRGLAEACDGDAVCVEGQCVTEPACAPGVSGPCLFNPQGAHGEVRGWAVSGDYLYWYEEGSFDALENYLNDGVLARTKVGTWQREEVRTGLDFLHGSGYGGIDSSGDWILLRGEESSRLLVSSVSGARQFAVDVAHSYACVASDGILYYEWDGVLYEFADGTSRRLRDVPPDMGNCAVFGDNVWTHWFDPYSHLDVRRFDRQTGGQKVFSPGVQLLDVRGDTLIGVRRGSEGKRWIAMAQAGESNMLTWQNKSGGTGQPYGDVLLLSNEVFWARYDTQRQKSVILRGSLGGLLSADVVAEMHDVKPAYVGSHLERPLGGVYATQAGVLWTLGGWYGQSQSKPGIHFAPVAHE